MRAGKLRYLVTVQTPTPSNDANGEPRDSWGTLTTAWADIVPVGGDEGHQPQRQIVADSTHRIRLRYDTTAATITARMRVVWGSRTFQIGHKRTVDGSGSERNRMIELEVTERTLGA